MDLKIGDEVEVIGSNSIPESFLGKRGKVTKFFMGKAMVEFIPREGTTGSLSHTAIISDLKKVVTRE